MKGLLVVFIVLFSQYTFAQGISSVLDKSTNPGEVLVEFDNRSAEIKGSYYLFNEWQGGDLILNSGASINEQLLNYDVEYDLLEVKLADEVKIVPLSMLREFYILGKNDNKMLFLTCENYFYDQKIPMVGMCEVIDSNYYGLISRFDIDIKESTYIPAFDMGNREDELIVTKKLYLTKANKAIEIPKKKQSFIQLYPDRTDLSSFIKEHKLNPKNKDDLLIILDFLNEDQHFQ
jgi:hypothetical protein